MKKQAFARKRQYRKMGKTYISEYQAFDLFSTQAEYILAGLRRFYSMKRWGTSPNDILEKACKRHGICMEDSYEEHKEAMDAASAEARAEWDADLCEMIYIFDQIANDFPDSPLYLWTSEESDKLDKQGIPHFRFIEKDAAGSVYESNLPETPDSVWEEEEAYRKRIQDGLHLYAEHFLALWDRIAE